MYTNCVFSFRNIGLIIVKTTKKLLVLDYGVSNVIFETFKHVLAPIVHIGWVNG
jgi:hypothetical protein